MDIIVDHVFQRRGIGQSLINHMLNHPELAGVARFVLRTADAHGVYAKSGFRPLENQEEWMVLQNQSNS